MIYIFDVEGTLSVSKWREHLIPDWDAFHDKFPMDKVYDPMARLMIDLSKIKSAQVYVLTGMMEKHRAMLNVWLDNHVTDLPPSKIIMRANDDLRKSFEYKVDFIQKFFLEHWRYEKEQILVFDDRDDIIFALREAGIPCVHVVQN